MLCAPGEAGAGGATPPLPAIAEPARTSPQANVTTATKADRRTGGGILRGVVRRTRVQLPAGVGEAFEVFVNGVPQQAGRDFRLEGDELVFDRSLAREGKLGFWRWASIFLGVAGTYRQNDSVDVVYQAGGRRVVATSLPLTLEE
jgi:hypothetical protein